MRQDLVHYDAVGQLIKAENADAYLSFAYDVTGQLQEYAPNPTGWIDPLGLSGTGGAYMFEWKNGGSYIGKGEAKRFEESKDERKRNKPNNLDCLKGEAWITTDGDNEMGKMVENRTMFLRGFKVGAGRESPPAGYANDFMSGNTAFNKATEARQDEATRLAKKLIAKFEADKLLKSKLGKCT